MKSLIKTQAADSWASIELSSIHCFETCDRPKRVLEIVMTLFHVTSESKSGTCV
jgi:hypothetical protein